MRGLTGTEEGDQRDVIAAIFRETYNRMLSGYLLRDVVNLVNRINFNSSDDIYTLSHVYEDEGLQQNRSVVVPPLPVARKTTGSHRHELGRQVLGANPG